jgi:hypothetical protein
MRADDGNTQGCVGTRLPPHLCAKHSTRYSHPPPPPLPPPPLMGLGFFLFHCPHFFIFPLRSPLSCLHFRLSFTPSLPTITQLILSLPLPVPPLLAASLHSPLR